MTVRALERIACLAVVLSLAGACAVLATRPHTAAAVTAKDTTVLTDRQLRAYIVERVTDDAAKSGETLLFTPRVNTLVHAGPDKVVVDMTIGTRTWGSGRQVDFLLERGWHVTGWCVRGVPCESSGG